MSVYADPSNNVFIADAQLSAVFKVDAASTRIYCTAGIPYHFGYNGDGIEAIEANLNYPVSVGIKSNGSLYICDT